MGLCSLLVMKECNHAGKYSENPFCKFSNKDESFSYIVDRMASKLVGWKQKNLLFAGRYTLIKSVALANPAYVMQVFLLPINICNIMDRPCRRFLWGHQEEWRRGLILKTWDNIYTPKQAWGLGIRRTRDANIAQVTKLGWKVCIELNRTWVKLIRFKYLRGKRIVDF